MATGSDKVETAPPDSGAVEFHGHLAKGRVSATKRLYKDGAKQQWLDIPDDAFRDRRTGKKRPPPEPGRAKRTTVWIDPAAIVVECKAARAEQFNVSHATEWPKR